MVEMDGYEPDHKKRNIILQWSWNVFYYKSATRGIILLYVPGCHIMKFLLMPTGIKFKYINDQPFPYRVFWNRFCRGR